MCPALQTSEHNWHVHQYPPQLQGETCSDMDIGPHFNPFSVSLGQLYYDAITSITLTQFISIILALLSHYSVSLILYIPM